MHADIQHPDTLMFFFSSRRRHTRFDFDWSSDVCSSDLLAAWQIGLLGRAGIERVIVSCGAGAGEQFAAALAGLGVEVAIAEEPERLGRGGGIRLDRKSVV